jgi:hypothetical protein
MVRPGGGPPPGPEQAPEVGLSPWEDSLVQVYLLLYTHIGLCRGGGIWRGER